MEAQVVRITRVGLAAVVVLSAAACTRPFVPNDAALAKSQLASTRLVSLAQYKVKKPVLGVDIYMPTNYSATVMHRDGPRDLAYIKDTLKASSVGIVWNLYAPSHHSNVIKATKNSLTPANVKYLTGLAKADHLTVQYRPLIKIETGKQWEGYIAPASQSRWFASYYKAELPYLKIAQKMDVKEVVTGTELALLNGSSDWKGFLKKVKHVYHGVTSYATYGHQYYPNSRHLLPVSQFGVTAYPDFNLSDSASVSKLVKAWKAVFKSVPSAIKERTAIDEIGIPALNGAYHEPWNWNKKGKLNETVQARYFTSACEAVKDMHLRAIYFWNVNFTDYPAQPPFPSPPTFEGKKGATAIAGCAKLFS